MPIRVRRPQARQKLQRVPLVAALDLGSNSFHLIVARQRGNSLLVVDRLQETVRLAAGLDADNRLGAAAQRRALETLERFGERLRGLPPHAVRAVGTNALRCAHNRNAFLARAQRVLGHVIEVIAGQEEARLIYLGVTQGLPADARTRLVVDIGGGSTEAILGRNQRCLHTESLHIGCVSHTQRYFAKGRMTAQAFRQAELAARLELKPVEAQFRRRFDVAYGSSGTIRAVAAIVQVMGWSEGEITAASLRKLRDAMIDTGHAADLDFPGLSPERAAVLPGGVAVLAAVFEALGVKRMRVAPGALREGLLHDLVGRMAHRDVRAETLRVMATRYHVDTKQAGRVAATARRCFSEVARVWDLSTEDGDTLSRAAQLHEIGLAVAHTKYHRHGAYLAEFSDLPGFSWQEQRLLAALIRTHRRRMNPEAFGELPREVRRRAERLAMLLRLAVLLHRGRTNTPLPRIRLRVTRRGLHLRVGRAWLRRNPLTAADLGSERAYLREAGFRFHFE